MKFEHLLSKNVESMSSTRHILLIDGDDSRSIEAAKILKKFTNIKVTLLLEKSLEEYGIDQKDLNFLNMNDDKQKILKYVNQYFELRKGKETFEQAKQALSTRPFYAMMLLHNEVVDGVVGGLNYSTADILRSAFKVIGPKQNIKTISSVMIMHKDDEALLFSDISVNPKPNKEQLAEIALNAAEFGKKIGFNSKVAFLSFSTNGSAKTDETVLVKEACDLFNEKWNGIKGIGEVQLDAAIDLQIRKIKYNKDSFEGKANILIFPDLGAGNIGYKLVQRLAGYGAIGPVVVGTRKPVNDLSRGSLVNDVTNTVLITALQVEGK